MGTRPHDGYPTTSATPLEDLGGQTTMDWPGSVEAIVLLALAVLLAHLFDRRER